MIRIIHRVQLGQFRGPAILAHRMDPIVPDIAKPQDAGMPTALKWGLAAAAAAGLGYAVYRSRKGGAVTAQDYASATQVQAPRSFSRQFGSAVAAGESERRPWSRLPVGWTEDSLEDFWDSVGGRVRTCIKKIGDRVDDPGAFCASIADRIEGPAWRSREIACEFPSTSEAARSPKSFQVGDVVKYSRDFLRSTMSEDRQGVVQSIYDMPASPFKHWPRVLWEDETEPKLVAPSNLVLKSRIHLELP